MTLIKYFLQKSSYYGNYHYLPTTDIENIEYCPKLIITQKSTDLFPEKKVFKLQFDSFGKHFYLQIIDTSHYIRYEEIMFKRLRRKKPMYLYTFSFIKDYNLTTPYQIRYSQNLFHRISVIFNNKTASAEVNQFTAMLFYRYSPFNHKVEIKNQMRQINPSDDLYFIFQNHSGYLLMIEGDGPFVFREKRIKSFCWLHPYYNDFLNKGTAIGLDATFRVLKPYKLCVPQCIINNTGVPLGIATAPSESFALYSLLFETVFQLDNNTFQTLQRKAFISDEHKSFNKLQSVYNIKIYKCIMHLIRSVGANSLLGFLFKDILYSYTDKEFDRNQLKYSFILKNLYAEDLAASKNKKFGDAHYIKVGKSLGIDPHGNYIPAEESYSPLYRRISLNVPTTNNHCESYHSKINSIAGDQRYTINNRLSLLSKHIMNRLKQLDQSSLCNLRTYIRNLKKKANEKVEKNPQLLDRYNKYECDCQKSSYYSKMYGIDLPCIHMILNDKWDTDVAQYIEHISISSYYKDQKLKFLVIPETLNQDENNEEEEEKDKTFISDNDFVYETKVSDDPEEMLIYNTYKKFKKICKIDQYEVGGIVAKAIQEILDSEENKEKMHENYDEYLALVQVKTWTEIIRRKGLKGNPNNNNSNNNE